MCSFTVACDRKYQKEGERQADFISCVAWRNTAEFISKYFPKGTRIALEGSIQTRSWDDNDGNKRYATEVVVEHAEFAQSKGEGSDRISDVSQAEEMPKGDIDGFMPIDDEDLPFEI